MIEILKKLEGIEGRLFVVEQATLLQTEAEAVWFAESLLMADWFHQNETPIAKMLPGTLVPVALTTDHRVIVFSATDYAYWTQETAAILDDFTKQYSKYSDRGELWTADQVSPRFVKEIRALGWTVTSDNRSTVLPEIPWGIPDDGN